MGDYVTPLEQAPALNGGGGGFGELLGGVAPPELPVTMPPTIDLSGIAPIQLPPDPFPGAPTVTPPPLPEGPFPGPTSPPETPPTSAPGPVYPMPPGAPGSPENPIPVTGTGQMPQPPPFPPPPPGPVIEQPPPVTVTQTSAGGGAIAIATASINQAISIINQDVAPLATAVQQGIAQGAQDASQIAQQTTQAITDSLNGFTNGLFGWVRDLWQWLKDNIGNILSTVANALKDVGKALLDGIVQGLKDIGQFFTQTIGPILTKIGDAVAGIANFYQQHIAPILNVIAAVERTVAGAITAIEKDINSGLQGILRLPGDFANALSNLGNELIRAGRALQVTRKADANVYFYSDEPMSFAAHIKALGDAVIGLGGAPQQTTYAPGNETLSEPTLAQELPALLETMNTILFDIAKGIGNLITSPTSINQILSITELGLFTAVVGPLELLAAIYEIMKVPLETVGELAGERAREAAPLNKLDPATLTAAWRRNLISQDTMDKEMLVQGWNGERSELLRRLSTYVEDAPSLVEYYYRGVVASDDLTRGLTDLGYTPPQIDALIEGSNALLDVTTAVTAYRRGEMDEATFNHVLAANRHPDAQAALLKALAFAPPNYATAVAAEDTHRFMSDVGLPEPTIDNVPPSVRDAGKADGLSDEAIAAQWLAQVNTLPATAWLNLYFRGMASRAELLEALFRDHVPEALAENWIDSQRPLIPFRTIPAMITAGILSEADGLRLIQEHGFSLENAVLLLRYATRQSKTTKAATATAQKTVSEAQAKTAYEDGLIGRDQYLTLLEAHGWAPAAALLEVQLTDIAIETKDRKQVSTDIVNQYEAGMIDQQTALQLLAQSGLTPAEQAAAAKKLTSAKSAKAKIPSEAELRAFALHDIITPDDYQSTLVVLGYSEAWAAAFRALHFPIVPPPAAATA